MEQRSRKLRLVENVGQAWNLGEHIHEAVRATIERVVEEELENALGAAPYERAEERHGYRNGTRPRQLTGPTGPVDIRVPRGILFTRRGEEEWTSKTLPRYQRRLPEINAALAEAYLAGANTRRIKGALRPLLREAPLSKSAVSRVVATLKDSFERWCKRSLQGLDVVFLYLDAFALKVRSGGKVVSMPVLAAVAVLADGSKQLVALEMSGGESNEAWKGFVAGMVARGMQAPLLVVIDGNAGLRRAVGETWPKADVQRCTVHKLRNVKSKAPAHAREEVGEDCRRVLYAEDEAAAREALAAFERKWGKRCPGAVASLAEGGDDLLTYYRYPVEMWKTIRTTNVIERLNGEFRRRVKTQASHPAEDAAVVLLFSLVASGQVKLRKLDGFEKVSALLSTRMRPAA